MKQLIPAFAAAILAAGCGPDQRILQVYNWSDYISNEFIARFEKEHDCKVAVTSFASNEEMYAKLKAGGLGYDIVVPSSYQIDMLVKEGLIERLDHSLLPNVKKNFDRRYAAQVLDLEMTYSVPYVVTYTGFLYSKGRIPTGKDPDTWAVFGYPELRGKISFLDDIREVVGAGLMYNGYSINSTDGAEIDKAVETVLAWKANIRKFDSESYRTEVPGGSTWLGHGYSSDSAQVILGGDETEARSDLAFGYPKEGFCIAFDELVVLKTAKNKGLAYAFINELYDTDNALGNMNYVCGIMPHSAAIEGLSPEYKALFIPPPEVMKAGQVLKSLSDDPAATELYNKAWDRIKAAKD